MQVKIPQIELNWNFSRKWKKDKGPQMGYKVVYKSQLTKI
jgi:hypothetical protein